MFRSCGRKICVCRKEIFKMYLNFEPKEKIIQKKKNKKSCMGSYKVMVNNLEKVNWFQDKYGRY